MQDEMSYNAENLPVRLQEGAVSSNEKPIIVLDNSYRDQNPKVRETLAAALQMFNASDLLRKLKKGTEYVVRVPAQFQKELQDGALEMLHSSKKGNTYATLVRKLADGKQEFVCNCPIVERSSTQVSPTQSLSEVYQNLFMQQRLNELSEQVMATYDVVLRIEQGQKDDRIGKLKSGLNDIKLALQNPNDFDKRRELELARSKISEAQGQIGQIFKSRVEEFRPIPESRWRRRLKEFLSPSTSYMKKQDAEFERLQEYYALYLRATQLLGWSFTIVGDTIRADTVFEQSMSFMKTIDFSNVQTLDYIYPSHTMDDVFYRQAVPYLEAEKKACEEEALPSVIMPIITTTMHALQEVLENEQAIREEKDRHEKDRNGGEKGPQLESGC